VQNVEEVLFRRVDELLHSRGQTRILSTTGTKTAVALLEERVMVLEEAVRQLAAAVEGREQSRHN